MRTLLSLLLAVAPLAAQSTVAWEHNYAQALARAQAERKPIFMDLWAEWCGPCRYLKDTVFPSPEAQEALKGYVPLSSLVQKKNGEAVADGTNLAKSFALRAYPTLIILDDHGKELRRHVGAFRSGAELAEWLKK
jgi:thiol:disulfide interchange protein